MYMSSKWSTESGTTRWRSFPATQTLRLDRSIPSASPPPAGRSPDPASDAPAAQYREGVLWFQGAVKPQVGFIFTCGGLDQSVMVAD